MIVGFKGGFQLWVWLIQAIHTATRCMGFPVFPKLTLSSSIDGGVCLFTGSQVGLGVTCFFCLLSNRALLVRTESPLRFGIGSCPASYASIGDAFLSILVTDTPCDWVISIPPGWSGLYNNFG